MLLIAVWFRFYDIQNYPPGLFPDEAANGEDVLFILEGDWRPFYARGNGREGLFFYLQALSVALFGIGVWQMHVVSATVGVATVLATYCATRVWFGRLAGVFAALLLATNHWHVTLSRTGFRAILIPLFIALFTALVGALVQAVRQRRVAASYLYAFLAGVSLAGGMYTYIAFRVMLGVLVGMLVALLLATLHPRVGFSYFKCYGGHMVVGMVAAAIALLPLGLYFMQHPHDFLGRAGQVSIFNRDLQQEYGGGTLGGTLSYAIETTLLSFFAGAGDLNWRHSVAGYPLLNPLGGILFLLGLAWVFSGAAVTIKSIARGRGLHFGGVFLYALLLIGGMLLPVVTSGQGLPHGLRSVGLIFPIFMIVGMAAAVILHWLARRAGDLGRGAAYGAVVGLLILGMAYDGALYFLVARNTAEAHYFYRGDLTAVADFILQYAHEHPDAPRPYLALDAFSLQTVHFLTHTLVEGRVSPPPHDYLDHPDEAHHRYRAVEPEASRLTVLQPGEIIIFTQSTMVDADRYAASHDGAELLLSQKNRFGEEIMRVYTGSEGGAVEGVREDGGGTAKSDLDA